MSNALDCDGKSLFMLLAKLNDQMIGIWRTLNDNPAVLKASRWCDLTNVPDPMEPDEERAIFDSSVEVETQGRDAFSWSIQLCVTAKSWKFYRGVEKTEAYGAVGIIRFDEAVFERSSELAQGIPLLVEELAESARTFNFSP